jgi:hypothetical protein
MRVIKVLIAWSGPGFGTKLFHSQSVGAEKPRVISVLVDRGFCPQSLYGIRTYDHKYTLKLENSDGALDSFRTLWSRDQSFFSVYATESDTMGSSWPTDTGSTDLKFARQITRVTVTSSEVILESDGGNIGDELKKRLAQDYGTIYNTFSVNKPQLWTSGRVLCDVDPIQTVGASTDFDEGSRANELSKFYVNGAVTGTSAAVGAGDWSVATATADGKRTAALMIQPTIASPATAQDAFIAIMTANGFTGSSYVDDWARGAMDETALIGVSAREESSIEVIEKIISGYDAGLCERSDGKIAVVCLQDFYQLTTGVAGYDLTQLKIEKIEVESAPFDGLGQFIAWNQNDAVHASNESKIADPDGLTAPYQKQDTGVTYDDVYKNGIGVKDRVFLTWFNDNGTGPVADASTHLGGFFASENMIINIQAPGFDLQELNPGDKVLLTHERFDLGAQPNKFQLLNLRYDMLLLNTSLQLIGKRR